MLSSEERKKRRVEICRNAALELSRVMTDEDKIARARAGGEAVAASMTAAQRTARARKAAQTRHAKVQPEASL